jgi:RNA polymerase sigma-70 factor (ECF subfamily)
MHISGSLHTAAFEILFKEHFKPLCFVAFRYLKDMDSAKEIVQDAFMSLWEKRDVIQEEKSVTSYLFVTVKNKCLNQLRSEKKFLFNLAGMENLEVLSISSFSDSIESKEIKSAIDAAIASLPEKCREIFLLSRNEQLKYHEIAEKLGLSVKTVETQMSRALVVMREQLKEFLPVVAVSFLIIKYFLHG